MAQNKIDKIKNFRKVVWRYYRAHGRHDLPWRQNHDLYNILVSEVMLQQTQVERVIPFYKKFIKQFPTAKKLAAAPLSEVLKSWQGLGYNRRAKMLHEAAKELSKIPNSSYRTNLVLEQLPGVGPYTANAITAFAYNEDVIVIETNIRTAVIHNFYPNKKKVSDKEIEKILIQALPKGRAREWYSALMDYGAFLKKSGISHNARTKTYTKQSKFVGSLREARGAILRTLAASQGLAFPQGDSSSRGVSLRDLTNLLDSSRRTQLLAALAALQKEGFIQKKSGRYLLSN